MEENAQGAVELNEVQGIKREQEEALQELYDVQKELATLELPQGFKPVTISKYKEVKLSEQIAERDVIAIELESEEQERQTLLYKRLEDRRLSLIATINEKNEILLDEEYRKKYEGIIRREVLEKPYVVDKDEMEKQKEAEVEPEKEQEQEEPEKSVSRTTREIEIAKALGVSPDQILNVVEIKDEATMSNVLNRNLETKNLYAVKLRQDSGGIGSNDWVIVNQKANGSFEKAMKEDPSDTLQDLGQTLGIRNRSTDIREGDISAISAPKAGTRNVEVNRYRFQDGSTYVLQLNRDYEADLHVFQEQDGKLEPLCAETHGRHEEETIELPDRDGQVEENNERTPWGDAEARRQRY